MIMREFDDLIMKLCNCGNSKLAEELLLMKQAKEHSGEPIERDISEEEWREYTFQAENRRVYYRISNPIILMHLPGGREHYIISLDGLVHCVPAPGQHGCICRSKIRKCNPRFDVGFSLN